MLRNKNKKDCLTGQFGFTMTELLIVIFIISLLSSLTLIGYRNGQKKYILSHDSQQLVTSLRKAQNMAISGINISGQHYGYGIYIEQNDSHYIIYADKNNNLSFQPSDGIIETINLSDKIEIQGLSPLSNKVDIFFQPPDPITYVDGSDNVGLSATITLGIEETSLNKTITITTAGLIEEN